MDVTTYQLHFANYFVLSYNLDYLSDNTLSALTSNQLHFRYEVFPLPSAALKSKS